VNGRVAEFEHVLLRSISRWACRFREEHVSFNIAGLPTVHIRASKDATLRARKKSNLLIAMNAETAQTM